MQAKLKVGAPNDRFEREADRVADQVVGMAEPRRVASIDPAGARPAAIQRLCSECEEEVRRQPIGDGQEEIQLKRAPGAAPEIGPGLQAEIGGLRGGGRPLAQSERAFFEPRFGTDFSQVRVHTGGASAGLARSINARAFTLGRDVVFGTGEYAPDSKDGRRLMAHELTHVVQQGGAASRPSESALAAQQIPSAAGRRGRWRRDPNGAVSVSRAPRGVQRLCHEEEIGAPTGCGDADPVFVAGRFFRMNRSCDQFAPGQQREFARFFSSLPAGSSFEVHGYASEPGGPTFNLNLSCARGLEADAELGRLGAGGPRQVFRHGETPGPAAEREGVVIVTTTPAPPAAPPPAPVAQPFLDLQIACVTDAGGCGNTAGIPGFDTQCRDDTGYGGAPVTAADLVCGTPGLGIARSLNRAYPGWLGLLPDCPCTEQDAEASADFSGDWNPLLQHFHPGAAACYRSRPVQSVPGTQHRQQCCYNRFGTLITQGGGAGTPDAWSGLFRHRRIDVQPFTDFGRDHRIYNRFWVPNQGGSDCFASDPCINRCEQVFAQCGAANALECIARRSACLQGCR